MLIGNRSNGLSHVLHRGWIERAGNGRGEWRRSTVTAPNADLTQSQSSMLLLCSVLVGRRRRRRLLLVLLELGIILFDMFQRGGKDFHILTRCGIRIGQRSCHGGIVTRGHEQRHRCSMLLWSRTCTMNPSRGRGRNMSQIDR